MLNLDIYSDDNSVRNYEMDKLIKDIMIQNIKLNNYLTLCIELIELLKTIQIIDDVEFFKNCLVAISLLCELPLVGNHIINHELIFFEEIKTKVNSLYNHGGWDYELLIYKEELENINHVIKTIDQSLRKCLGK